MDPLSITASIITVLQSANAVVSICYDYNAAVSGSSWELLKVIDEIRGLRNVLENLEHLTRHDAEDRLPSLRLLCEPGTGLLARCLAELMELDRKLRPPNWSGPASSKRRALIQASSWPLKKGTVERSLVNIGRLKETISLAIMADETKLTMAIQDTTNAILRTTVHTRRDVNMIFDSFRTKDTEDNQSKIYEWLSAPDPSSNYNKARELCQPMTGLWFVQSEQFKTWKEEENSFIWMYGIPGCGKTILSSTIVENVIHFSEQDQDDNLHSTSSSTVLQFYFDFNDIEKQGHEKMIRSLVWQLSVNNVAAPQPLRLLYAACLNGQRQPTTDSLLDTLRDLLQGYDRVFLVLDALDECTDRSELLSAVTKISAWQLGIRILVTSRIETEIGEYLNRIGKEKIGIQSALVDSDIRAYVQERLSNDWKLRRWKNHSEIRNEIENTLTENAGGMFRWVVCQLDALGKCLTVPMLRKALQSLPSTLDETYARILRNVDDAWGPSVARILEWLVFSATPLHLAEVAELVAIDINEDPPFDPSRRLPEPKDILTMCSSLITITRERAGDGPNSQMIYEDITHEYYSFEDIDDATEPTNQHETDEESKIIVRLGHFSVKEYLLSREVRVGSTIQYHIREIPVNISITEICLIYLFQFDQPNSLTSETLGLFPLLRYAARNWLTHARIVSNNSNHIISLIMKMFLGQGDIYKNWIRVFDPERVNAKPSVWQYAVQPCSPLYYCSLGGLLEPARQLIDSGADVNLQEGDLGCPLLAALKNEHEDIARLLVHHGADVAASAPNWPVGMTALHRAARDGYEALAAKLVRNGADVNARTDTGETPLHMAVERGSLKIAKLLLGYGAEIEAQDNVGKVPLYDAVVNKDQKMVELLLDKGGADIEVKDHLGRTIIFIAIETGALDIIHVILERVPNLQNTDIQGQSLIHYAARSGLITVVERLLSDIRREDDYGRTALHVACDAGHSQVVHLLLSQGANIEARTSSGQTPLFYAAIPGHVSIVEQLLDRGANMKTRDDYGGSVLYTAAAAGEEAEAVVDLLIDRIETKTKSGRTLLHHAVAAGDVPMVERLIKRGMNLDERTAAGETPLYMAIVRGRYDIANLLQRARRRARRGATKALHCSNDEADHEESDQSMSV